MVAESAWGGGFWYGFGRIRTAKMGKAQIGEYQQSPPTLRKRANSLISGAFSLFSHTFPILFLHGSRMALVLGHGFEAGMGDLVTDRGRLGYGLLMGYGGGIVPVGWGIGVVGADFCGRSGFGLPKSSSAEENKRNCLDKAFLLWYSFLAGRGGAGTVLPEQGAFPRLSGVTPLMALGNAATHDGCSLSIPRRRINRRDRPYQRAFPSCASKNYGLALHLTPCQSVVFRRSGRSGSHGLHTAASGGGLSVCRHNARDAALSFPAF